MNKIDIAREGLDLPNMSEYVPIKEAARLLGVSDKRVYALVEDGRLSAVRAAHIIMIPVHEVREFQARKPGRPRKNTPVWRVPPEDNLLLTTSVCVQIKVNQQQKLRQRLEVVRREEFPGTVARYITWNKARPETLTILLIWRSATIPDEATRWMAFATFLQILGDTLDRDTVQYSEGRVLLYA